MRRPCQTALIPMQIKRSPYKYKIIFCYTVLFLTFFGWKFLVDGIGYSFQLPVISCKRKTHTRRVHAPIRLLCCAPVRISPTIRGMQLPVFGSPDPYAVQPSKIVALGKNYLDHIAEERKIGVGTFTAEPPENPILFAKTPNTLAGPGQAIRIPAFLYNCGFQNVRTHYEAELAFFIKDRCRHVAPERAYEHIFGFTCANDVSQRNIQGADASGWFRGKSLDTFCPVGPQVVRMEDIGDPQNLRILCRLNGTTVQDSNTRHMIFPVREIVAYISMNFTLEPGDLILTGTPAGVGAIAHGDVVEVEIERIGVLRNPIVDERRVPAA